MTSRTESVPWRRISDEHPKADYTPQNRDPHGHLLELFVRWLESGPGNPSVSFHKRGGSIKGKAEYTASAEEALRVLVGDGK